LQNVDFRGTRFPHRVQKEPEGGGDVAAGWEEPGTFSMIVPFWRAISIFFFAGRVLVTVPCVGVGTSRFVNDSLSTTGTSEGAMTGADG
jgi:hypothetical protein